MGQPVISQDPSRIAEALFAEKAILGTLLSEPDLFSLIVGKTECDDFYDPRHKRIFLAALTQHNECGYVDFISVYDRLESLPFDVLADLADHVMPGSVEQWIEKVHAAAARRKAQEMLQGAMNDLGRFDTDLVANFKNMSDEAIKLIAPRSAVGNMQDGMIETIKNIEIRKSGKIIRTGLSSLDMLVGGFRPGQLWVVAGRTSMGKSSLAQNMILAVAHGGNSAGYVSIEGKNDEMRQRLLAIEARVGISEIGDGNISDNSYPRIVAAHGRLAKLPISYVDGETIWSRVRAKIQLLKFEDPNLAVIFVDYIGLIQNPQYRNRWEAIGAVSAELKNLAQTLGVAIVAVCQINRETEHRKDHRPMLADLRDAGSIEQDADVILLLYRPHYYDKKADDLLCQIGIAKQRNGPTGHIEVNFDGHCVRFFDR